jgi:hypothetical protein
MRLLPLALLPLLLLACVTTTPAKSSTAQCPGSNEVCMAGKDCSYDKARDCTLCVCRRTDRERPASNEKNAYPEGTPETKLPPLGR